MSVSGGSRRSSTISNAASDAYSELVLTLTMLFSSKRSNSSKIGALYEMRDRPGSYLNIGLSAGESKSGGFGQCTPSAVLFCTKASPSGSYSVNETVMMLKVPKSPVYRLDHEALMLFYANSVQDALVGLCRQRQLHSSALGHPSLGARVSRPPYVVRLHHYLPEQVLSSESTVPGARGSVTHRYSDGLLLQLHSTSLRCLLRDLKTDADKLVIMQRLATILRFLSVHCKVVHGDFHVSQVLVDTVAEGSGRVRRPAYEAMVLCDLGNSVLVADKRDFLHGVASTTSPDPVGLATFRSAGPDEINERIREWSSTYKESRLRCIADDWWAFYITCHRVLDAPELKESDKFRALEWDNFHPPSARDPSGPQNKLHNVKSACLFGIGCKTRRGVEASVSRPTPWRLRPALLPAFRDALEEVFRILVEAEISEEGFTDASVDAICSVLAQTKL